MDATPATIEPLVTVRQAARLLNIGRHVLYRAGEAGELPIYDAGGWSRIRLSDLQAWLERTKRAPRGAA
jgi:excisionase family DNA binding protein